MKLPLKWLKEYVSFNVSIDEFIEKMMWRGFELDALLDELPDIKNIIVGKIVAMERHPQADRLSVCSVDVGDRILQIVTNATNVRPGDLVPVAKAPATVSGGTKIDETIMRGVKSDGMFCSYKEIGITDLDYPGCEYDGVLILREDFVPGTDIRDALDMNSVIFDFDITPNRTDCLSIIGICREAAAALGVPFVEPKTEQLCAAGETPFKVTVLNGELCPRYCAHAIENIRIEPSPAWMQKKLRLAGLRPINNIVDITNYVLLEYGHPMHAFDMSCINGGHIIVRNAFEGEKVTTLDSKERELNSSMLVIADETRAVALAGVMGGENSEITPLTRTVLFESAAFVPSNIRRTSRALHHTTDSAQRFIRGVEPQNAMLALNRALELVSELGAGVPVGETVDVLNADISPRFIDVDCKHINEILGSSIEPKDMAALLAEINMEASVNGDTLRVLVPHYRTDIMSDIEADWDISEEIGRLYGYSRLTPTMMSGNTFCGFISEDIRDEDKLKDAMVSLGAYEMYNYNFISPDMLARLRLSPDDRRQNAVKLLNPFGTDQSLMRTTLIAPVLNTLSLNIKRKTNHFRFFEVGNVHFDAPDLPLEEKHLAIAFMDEDDDFFTLKGAVETALDIFGIMNYHFVVSDVGCFKPGQRAKLVIDGEEIGELGSIHPDVLRDYELAVKHAFIAELDIGKLLRHKHDKKRYQPIPKYPTVPRDIAIVVDNAVTSEHIKDIIEATETQILIGEVKLFDVYRGKGIPDGKKSMAYSFVLYHKERTLTDKDIKNAMDAIILDLKTKANADLR